eukprot:TRINITY_DN6295_c0_g1_i1.p1 TRINITY_DN6295_c0_g1~~TRINITY_DN6295_c0_g1_i1.p1  ORF type:complete len:417 (+),score=14.15 TRINITY_DN6295_c0_g1_i1:37-1287(+)
MWKITLVALALAFPAVAVNNGLGITPPMGWNTWCTSGPCERDYCWEQEIFEIADALVSNGMKDLGYNYVNLDDCWESTERDSNGNMQPDPARFPHGMKYVADYLHSKGLYFGLYTCSGTETCVGGRPGSYGYYAQDAQTYADWEMDYVKMDWCNTKINGVQLDPRIVYHNMSVGLNATGRPIFFDACEWGYMDPWLWAGADCNAWRSGHDHHDQWDGVSGVAEIIEGNAGLSRYAGPGGWNDLDFLMTGGQGCESNFNATCPGMSWIEYRTEFAMWALIGSPLIVATDIRGTSFTPEKKEILMNTEIIAINQDPLGIAGDRIGSWPCNKGGSPYGNLTCQIWARPISGGSVAVNLYNKDDNNSHNITLDFSLIAMTGDNAMVRDLWAHEDLGVFLGKYSAEVPPHGVVTLKITPLA